MAIYLSITFLAVFSSDVSAQKKMKVRLALLGAKLGSDAQNFSYALGDIITQTMLAGGRILLGYAIRWIHLVVAL